MPEEGPQKERPIDPALTEVCVRREGLPPGFWEDGNGHIHASIPEILEHMGMPETPENRALVVEMVKEIMGKVAGRVFGQEPTVIYRTAPNPSPPLS